MAGLFEYAAKNPAQDPPQEQQDIIDTAAIYQRQQERAERAAEIKANIAAQLEQGTEPQFILYAAVEAIGLLTEDPDWIQAQQDKLNSIYADLAQQSFIADNNAIAADRRERVQQEYNRKLRGQLQRQLMGYRSIERGLTDALRALDNLDPQDPEDILNGT